MNRIMVLLCLAICAWSCAGEKSEIRVPGLVRGEVAAVRVLHPGRVQQVRIRQGQQVRRGELVIELERDKISNLERELDLAAAELQLGRAAAREKRRLVSSGLVYRRELAAKLERLQSGRSVSADQLEQARLALLEAETALSEIDFGLQQLDLQEEKLALKKEALQLQERDSLMLAPVDGTVLEVFVGNGEIVLPGMLAADILDETSLHLEVFVEEVEMSRLRLGGPALIEVDGITGRRFEGTIVYFGRKAEFSPKYILSEKERQSLLYKVKIGLPAENREVFKLSMPVTVILPFSQES